MSTMPLRVFRVFSVFLVLIALTVFCFQNVSVLSARLQLFYDLGFVRVAPFTVPVYALFLVAFLLGLLVDGLSGLFFWYKASVLEERLGRLKETKPQKESEDLIASPSKQARKEGPPPWDEQA